LRPVSVSSFCETLEFASSVFKRTLSGSWKESVVYLENGSIEITAESWDIEALLYLLHTIHGQHRLIPSDLSLENLAKVAIITDYYKWKEVIYIMTDI
jgi:hypothetical protein